MRERDEEKTRERRREERTERLRALATRLALRAPSLAELVLFYLV